MTVDNNYSTVHRDSRVGKSDYMITQSFPLFAVNDVKY